MKVWELKINVHWEDSYTLGLFTSEKKAIWYAKNYVRKNPEGKWRRIPNKEYPLWGSTTLNETMFIRPARVI